MLVAVDLVADRIAAQHLQGGNNMVRQAFDQRFGFAHEERVLLVCAVRHPGKFDDLVHRFAPPAREHSIHAEGLNPAGEGHTPSAWTPVPPEGPLATPFLARAAERRAVVTVRAILKGKGAAVVTAVPGETLSRIAQLIAEYRIGAVLILDSDGRPGGIVSERDIVNTLAAY